MWNYVNNRHLCDSTSLYDSEHFLQENQLGLLLMLPKASCDFGLCILNKHKHRVL